MISFDVWLVVFRHLRVKYVDNSQWAAQLDRLEDNEGKYVVALTLDNCSITFNFHFFTESVLWLTIPYHQWNQHIFYDWTS